jgi:pimeloyl-ACP methyl ester carboxylesterase
VIDLLDALNLREPVVLGGLSMGGYVALSAVVRYPDRFRALMLFDTRASADSPEAARNREALASQVEESGSTVAVVDGMLPKLFSPITRERRAQVIEAIHEEMVRITPRAVAGALRGMAARPDRSAELPRLTLPTLIMVGEDDVITPPAESRAMAQAIPNAQLKIIADAGHLAPVEEPVECNRAILAFLDALG